MIIPDKHQGIDHNTISEYKTLSEFVEVITIYYSSMQHQYQHSSVKLRHAIMIIKLCGLAPIAYIMCTTAQTGAIGP